MPNPQPDGYPSDSDLEENKIRVGLSTVPSWEMLTPTRRRDVEGCLGNFFSCRGLPNGYDFQVYHENSPTHSLVLIAPNKVMTKTPSQKALLRQCTLVNYYDDRKVEIDFFVEGKLGGATPDKHKTNLTPLQNDRKEKKIIIPKGALQRSCESGGREVTQNKLMGGESAGKGKDWSHLISHKIASILNKIGIAQTRDNLVSIPRAVNKRIMTRFENMLDTCNEQNEFSLKVIAYLQPHPSEKKVFSHAAYKIEEVIELETKNGEKKTVTLVIYSDVHPEDPCVLSAIGAVSKNNALNIFKKEPSISSSDSNKKPGNTGLTGTEQSFFKLPPLSPQEQQDVGVMPVNRELFPKEGEGNITGKKRKRDGIKDYNKSPVKKQKKDFKCDTTARDSTGFLPF